VTPGIGVENENDGTSVSSWELDGTAAEPFRCDRGCLGGGENTKAGGACSLLATLDLGGRWCFGLMLMRPRLLALSGSLDELEWLGVSIDLVGGALVMML
jgi:hypothetical protein